MNLWEILVWPVRPFEEQRYQQLMQEHHYLGFLPKIGETLWYVALAYSGILGGAIAWFLWFYALSHLPAGIAGLGTLGTPVVGVLAAWVQLGEIPTSLEIVGMILVIGALVLNSIEAVKLHQHT